MEGSKISKVKQFGFFESYISVWSYVSQCIYISSSSRSLSILGFRFRAVRGPCSALCELMVFIPIRCYDSCVVTYVLTSRKQLRNVLSTHAISPRVCIRYNAENSSNNTSVFIQKSSFIYRNLH